ncbi:MAG: hypothetical protein LBG60_07450, partial [Bifidobacteriaceae bacterium]|nr:hypothetical protein [Bifidobacteriaceae bacterium]
MDQQTTHVAVTGHRPVARGEDRLFGGWKEYNRQASSPYYTRMRESLRGVVDEMLETHEHLTLHSGMALGVDTIWADVIVAARAEHPDRIAFTADIPTEDQAKIWLPPARAKWRELTAGADQVNVYADTYAPGVEGARNRGMVIGADTVIAIAGDQPSGSRRAIADAVNGGARLIQFDPMVFADETQDAAARRRGAAERPAGRPNSKAVKVEPVRVIHPRQASQAPPAEPGPEPPGEPEPKSEPDPALAALAAGGTQAARVVEVSRAGRGGAAMLVDLGDGAPRPVIVAPGKGSARLGQYIELTGQNIGVGRGAGKFFIGFSHNPEPVKVVQDLSNPALLEHDTRLVGWLMAVSHLDRRIAQMVKAGVDGGLISRAVAPVGLARIAIDAIDTPTSPEALAAGLDALARPRIAELAKYMPEADIGQIIAGLVAESAAEADGARAMVEALAAAHPGARPLTSINPLVSMDETIGEGLRLYAVYPANDGGPRVITRFPFKEVGRADLAARLGAPRNWEDRALNSLRGIPGTSWLRGRVYEEDWPKVETALGQAHAIHLAEAEDAGISAPRDQEAFAAAEAAQEAATARAILEYLDSENLPFRIKPNGARVDAVVERAGLPTAVVRLLDPQTPGWVGQVEQGRVATAVDRGVTGGERPTAEQALASVKVGFTPDLRTIGTDIVFRKDSREVTVDGTLIRTGARRGLEQAPSPLQAWDKTHKTP